MVNVNVQKGSGTVICSVQMVARQRSHLRLPTVVLVGLIVAMTILVRLTHASMAYVLIQVMLRQVLRVRQGCVMGVARVSHVWTMLKEIASILGATLRLLCVQTVEPLFLSVGRFLCGDF